MFNLIQADFYKITRSLTTKILFSIASVFAVVLFVGTYLLANGKISVEFTSLIFLTSDLNMMTLLGAVLAVHIIGGEFESRNMQHLITSGFSRWQIVVSKVFVYCVTLLFVMSPYLIGNMIALSTGINFKIDSLIGGFMAIVQNKEAIEIGKGILLLLIIALVYISQLSTTILFSFMFKKASLVIPLFYFISVASGQIALYKDQIGDIANMLKMTPFAPDYISIHPTTSNATLVEVSIVCVLYIVAITAISFLYFKKREIR